MKGGKGFGMVPTYLRGHLTPNELAVYVALTWRMGAGGAVFPSHATIAEDAGMGEKTARRTLQALREKGIVTWANRSRKGGGKTSNVYSINLTPPLEWMTDRSERPIPPVRETDEVDTHEVDASTKVVPTDAASRGQRDRRPTIDLEALIAEIDNDDDATGWLGGNWADGADGLVEAAWAELQTNDAINDKGAWLAAALSNQQTAVGKATRLLKIVGDDYDE